MIKYPNFLNKKDTIGITATSTGIYGKYKTLRLDNAHKNLNKLGYKTIETSNVRTNEKFTSSTPKIRATEFIDLWKNKDVTLIAQVRGGEFLMEILPHLNKEIFINNEPKWLTGYSDSSLLNFYITTNYNIATATTQNILHFGMENLDKSLTNQIKVLSGKIKTQESFKYFESKLNSNKDPYCSFNLTEKVEYKCLYKNQSTIMIGRLIGGCIDVISNLTGTPYDNTTNFCNQFPEGMLWYLENCELSIFDLYRTLWRMKQCYWFNNANGIIFGRTRGNKTIKDLTYLDVLHKTFDDLNIPIIYDVDFGHVLPQWTMINGSLATFEYKNGKGKITQEYI